MPTTFALADEEAHERVARMMALYHPMLRDAGVLVGILFASAEGGPSIRVKGAAVAATMQVVSLKDRVLKKVDAQMVIAREAWQARTATERNALCDHELSHLRLKNAQYWTLLGSDGKPRRGPNGEETGEQELRFDLDDLGRPKLVTVPGDVDVGDGFEAVIRRWGPSAGEYRNITAAARWAERATAPEDIGRPQPLPFGNPDAEVA